MSTSSFHGIGDDAMLEQIPIVVEQSYSLISMLEGFDFRYSDQAENVVIQGVEYRYTRAVDGKLCLYVAFRQSKVTMIERKNPGSRLKRFLSHAQTVTWDSPSEHTILRECYQAYGQLHFLCDINSRQ